MENREDVWKLLIEEVQERLPEGYHIRSEEMLKINGRYPALIIGGEGRRTEIVLYQKDLYEKWQDRRNWNGMLGNVLGMVGKYRDSQTNEVDPLFHELNYQECKNKIFPTLINYAWNRELLETMPHIRMQDLAMVFAVNQENSRVYINSDIQKKWQGISSERLYQDAMHNSKEFNQPTILSMEDILMQFLSGEEKEMFQKQPGKMDFLILTNQERSYGAFYIEQPEVRDELYQRMGEYYVLPSSLHEVILISCRDIERTFPGMGKAEQACELQQMVREINACNVAQEDRLSDHIYRFDGKELLCLNQGRVLTFDRDSLHVNMRRR